MFRVSTIPIIWSTQNCNYSLTVLVIFFVQLPPSNVAKLGHVGGSFHVKRAIYDELIQ